MGAAQAPASKTRNNSQPEGRQAKYVTHLTNYEGPAAMGVSVAEQNASADVRLEKIRGLGSPQRLLVTFVRTKVTRVRAGEARELSPEAARFGSIPSR